MYDNYTKMSNNNSAWNPAEPEQNQQWPNNDTPAVLNSTAVAAWIRQQRQYQEQQQQKLRENWLRWQQINEAKRVFEENRRMFGN